MTPQIVILGVGNLLMGDEGVGVHALVALEKQYDFPPNVRCVDGGTSTQELLGDLEHLDHLIVLDALTSGAAPASVVRLEGAAVPSAFTTKFSPHQIGIADLLATLTFLGRAPKHVVLFGVEPVVMELDLTLSPKVAARVPELCGAVVQELRGLGVHTELKSAHPQHPTA
jgi:hydrogenase maturation protease